MSTEFEITEKLLKEFHINVLERKLLPAGKVKMSMIKKVINKILKNTGWFPENWRPDLPFAGSLLEVLSENKILLYKKAEASFSNYKLIEKKEYSDFDEAITDCIKFMFGHEIDGIKIDYD